PDRGGLAPGAGPARRLARPAGRPAAGHIVRGRGQQRLAVRDRPVPAARHHEPPPRELRQQAHPQDLVPAGVTTETRDPPGPVRIPSRIAGPANRPGSLLASAGGVSQGFPEPCECPGAVDDLVLHVLTQLGEALLPAFRDEQRIIPEAVLPARRGGDASLADAFEDLRREAGTEPGEGDDAPEA